MSPPVVLVVDLPYPLFTFYQARLSGKVPSPARFVWSLQFNGLLSNTVYSVCGEYGSYRHQKAGSLISSARQSQVARGVLALHWEAVQTASWVSGCADCCGPSEVCLGTRVDVDSCCPIAPVLLLVHECRQGRRRPSVHYGPTIFLQLQFSLRW